jgi:alpha,alpha-trehalase
LREAGIQGGGIRHKGITLRAASAIVWAVVLTLVAFGASSLIAQPTPHAIRVRVHEALDSLLYDEDTDADKKITIEDPHIQGTDRGNKRTWVRTLDRQRFEVSGTYHLSNLLQELTLARESGADTASIRSDRIFEPPVNRMSRLIRDLYWGGLTRRLEEQGLFAMLADEKARTVDGLRYVYIPPTDEMAYSYFSRVADRHREWGMKVVRLPARITPEFVRGLGGRHGVLNLELLHDPDGTYRGTPFVVPGGRFNEMYGWDSYFIALGLLQDGRVGLAKSMVDNLIYEITYYGAILNGNRSYYLTRSQPPFLTSMALEVYKHLPKDSVNREWLGRAFRAAIKEYFEVWMNSDRLTTTGLSRYFDSGAGPPPEVEPGHFDAVYAPYAKKLGMNVREFEEAYRSGKITVPQLDRYFVHDRSMRESGHDTSYRLEGRSADLATVDLNSLLYKIELDIAQTIDRQFGGSLSIGEGRTEKSSSWFDRARRRKELVNRYLWNENRGMFFDYDIVRGKQLDYVSATTFYPMWAGLTNELQEKRLVEEALPLLEMAGGIAGSTEESRGPIGPDRPLRQWDYPFGWAPHQMLIWRALMNSGRGPIAERLIYRWLYTLTLNAVNYSGTIPEKYDVVNRTHQVFAEYGNVGTKFSYITKEGFGWTNASYQVGLSMLPLQFREALNSLIPPEWLFSTR